MPDPFYDVVTSSMELRIVVSNPSFTKEIMAELLSGVATALGNLTGLPPPELDRVVFLHNDNVGSSSRGDVRVFWNFRVRFNVNRSKLTELLQNAESLARLNVLLSTGNRGGTRQRRLGLFDNITRAEKACLDAEGLDFGDKFVCCERLLVYSLIKNAGVFVPYERCFPFAMTFLCCLAGIQAMVARIPCFADAREKQRIFFVAATFFASHTLVGLLTAIQSMDKFRMLAEHCLAATGVATESCPPSPAAMLLEISFCAFIPIIATGTFLCWRSTEWQGGGVVKRAKRLAALPDTTTQLEAVLRRSAVWASQEVRPTDAVSKIELNLLVVVNLLLSFAVVLTAFFALQKYEWPGRFTAWSPYKVIFESVVAVTLRLLIKKLVYSRMLGRMTPLFLCACITLFLSVDLFFWYSIYQMCRTMGLHEWADVQKLLGVTVGAGIINVFSSAFVYTMTLHLFSVYLYEPIYRYRKVHVFCLKSPEEVAQVNALYSDGWRLRGKPMVRGIPVQLEGLEMDYPTMTSSGSETDSCDSDDCKSTSSLESGDSSLRVDTARHRSPSMEAPVVVELQRTDEGRLSSGLLKLVDKLLSVDPALPLECTCRELPGDSSSMQQGVGPHNTNDPEPDQEPE